MALCSFQDIYAHCPTPIDTWAATDLQSFTLYGSGDQLVGVIRDLLVDDSGHFRYLIADVVVSLGAQAKTVLLPIGLAKLDYPRRRVVIAHLQVTQLRQLPAYTSTTQVDRRHEQRVRDILRPLATRRLGRQFLQQPYTSKGQYRGAPSGHTPSVVRDYNRYPSFYGLSEQDNQLPLKSLENQLP